MIHNTVMVWLIFLALPIAGCKKDENANLFCVEVTEDETETVSVNSMPIQKSISPKKLQSIVLDRIHRIRKKTSKESSPVFFLEYRCNGIKQGNTIPTKFMYDGERLALAILIDETWIPACWGDWESQKEWLRGAYTIENCATFLKRAEEIGLADPNGIDKTTPEPKVPLPSSNETNKATAELKVLSESLNADDMTRIGELLKAGADVNVENTHGATPLWMASQNNHVEVASLLLANGADVNTTVGDASALMIASQLGHAKIVELLLKNGADVNAKSTEMGITPLWIASQNGHAETVSVLLKNNADIDAKATVEGVETTALMRAEKYGHATVVQLLKRAAAQRSSRSVVPSDVDSSSTNIGKTITNSIGMKLVYIPAGEFMMGSPSSEEGRESDEGPQHRVRISKGFYMGATEVTQSQWERVMGAEPKSDDSLISEGASYPKVFVNWSEACEFCKKLSACEDGRLYRLPTEAQWEYACRAGTRTKFGFGNDEKDIDTYAWYKGNSTASFGGLYSAHEVGQKEPNPWGLYDMHGNVAERCRDNYIEDYYNRSSVNDPEGKAGLSGWPPFVIRGGWSGDVPADCRSARRKRDALGAKYNFLGFRIILEEDDGIRRSDHDTAFSELEVEAHRGNANAQNSLGSMYAAGNGAALNHEEAAKWFRKAADQGHLDAQFNLGKAYALGRGLPQDFTEAAKWYRKAADQGHANSQESLGSLCDGGHGVPQDHAEAMKWYRKAADQGHDEAQFNLGYSYARGRGVPRNYVEAMKWYRKAADQGDANAQNAVGAMYAAGQGVAQNHEEAAKWFRKAADQGFDAAQFNLGNAYAAGRGVSQDDKEAAQWFHKAADQRFFMAEYALGFKYLDGIGVPEDVKEAVKWFRSAADHGFDDAQYRMGLAYEYGIGVSQSHKEAATWYRKAADQGHADAQSKLGILYYKGLGVPKDYVLSSMWFTLSGRMAESAKTTTDATDAQVGLVDRMTQDQKDEANRLVREWKPDRYSENTLNDR